MTMHIESSPRRGWLVGAGRTMAMLALGASSFAWAAEPIEEGADYQVIQSGDGISRDGVVRVEEFFAYGCPHCHHLEGPLEAWLEKNEDEVELVRYPLPFSENSVAPTTAFYAAQKVLEEEGNADQLAKVHAPVFHALHEERRVFANAGEVRQFYAEQGVEVPAEAFGRVHDESAESLTRKAYEVFQTTQSRGVPTLVVDGRFVVGGKGPERTVEIVDALVARAQAED
ncbi:Thiol:disulfide interchange protein DsbA [Halopseudomonas xinjiangensis]|uniref:Thiol:disulfide interchange protein n=1 Tax=Halopseudomonas xinjiangensis TaxID=487184 RepID=A0A1H1W856_9GAMM|nr:thiol:disulfide interchange protein DsbA/DsbL [Halopseudomonas xinjiangensis]SDS93283.1 Thiol:disulfide interchange protein DsbA [Halopseudomonas xinjiangensis]